MSLFADALMLLSTVLLTVASWQFFTHVRSAGPTGVSWLSVLVIGLLAVSWLAYGLITAQPLVALPSVGSALFTAMLVWMYRAEVSRTDWVVAASAAGGLVAVELLADAWWLGLVLALSVLVEDGPQVAHSFKVSRTRRLYGVSRGSYVMMALCGLCWVVYGFVARDVPVGLSGVLQFATSSLVLLLAHRSRLLPSRTSLWPSTMPVDPASAPEGSWVAQQRSRAAR